jgi:hypothetical protein
VAETSASAGASTPDVAVAPTALVRHAAVWARLAAGVVVALLGTLLLVKVVGSSGSGRPTTLPTPTSAAVLAAVTGVPASVFDAVGVRSPAVPVAALHGVTGVTPLTTTRDGRRVPVVLFVGTEFCSFCAAERWPLVVALSRFGTFTSLSDAQSSAFGFAPNTPTFSFDGASYHSDYLVFRPYETASSVLGRAGYRALMREPASVRAVERRLDPTSTLPFVDVANLLDAPQAALSPITFVGLGRDQVAAGLHDPANPVTRAIVAAANELTAAICAADGARPTSVCASPGVAAARAVLRHPSGAGR